MTREVMSRSEFDAKVEEHVKTVRDKYNINVPMSYIKVETWNEKSKYCGRASNYGRYSSLKVNYYKYKTRSWEDVKETIRHEWAHCMQHYFLGIGNHGTTFRWLAERLDVDDSDYQNTNDVKYILRCPVCEYSSSVSKECDRVKRARNDALACYDCYHNRDKERLMNVERANLNECMQKLKELAFVEDDSSESEDNSWKTQALSNLQTAKEVK